MVIIYRLDLVEHFELENFENLDFEKLYFLLAEYYFLTKRYRPDKARQSQWKPIY